MKWIILALVIATWAMEGEAQDVTFGEYLSLFALMFMRDFLY
jgi:hypothetical protein